MRILIDRPRRRASRRGQLSSMVVGLIAAVTGCGGEPSQRELGNARAFEALLTAVSLKHDKEVENDARLIDERHAAGELSDEKYRALGEIIAKARAKDWAGTRSGRTNSESPSVMTERFSSETGGT